MKSAIRRRWAGQIILFAVLAVTGISAAVLIRSEEPGVTEDNYYRLRASMTEQQVEAILGFPGKRLSVGKDGTFMRSWMEEGRCIFVRFTPPPDPRRVDGRFDDTNTGFGANVPDEQKGFFAGFRRLLGL